MIDEQKAMREEIAELRGQVIAWQKQCDTLTHQVLCCGVAASHPDATLTTRGAYAGKWNSAQAESVRKLRAERDALLAAAPNTTIKNESILSELNARASIIAKRHELGNTDPVMAEQAMRDEQQLLSDTEAMDEHPDGYDGPCACKTCMSYE